MTNTIQNQLDRLEQMSLPYGARSAGRVEDLKAAFQSDYGAEPSTATFAALLNVCEAVPTREYTSLTLTPDGGWYVEWQLEDKSRLAIEFCDDGVAHFILHQRNPRHPSKTVVMSGSTTSDALVQTTINPLAPWMRRAA